MKKTLLVALLSLASTGAFATAACSDAAGNGTAVPVGGFVKVQFTPKCSASTLVEYTDQTTSFAVAAGSAKGKSTFVGNTAGGAVKVSGVCPASGCTATELATALTAAEALASGS